MKTFFTLWVGQIVSMVGSALTGFVLGVWTYELTGSVTQFALIMLSGAVPAILVAPVAGAAADRFDRKRLMIAADGVATVTIAVLAMVVYDDSLQVWHVYPVTAITAVCGTFHQIAFTTTMPLLVPKEHLGRANGLAQVVFGVQVATPVLAGTLLVAAGMHGVVLLDLVSYGVSLLILVLIRLPAALTTPGSAAAKRAPGWRDMAGGWAELRRRPGLPGVIAVLGGFYFCFGIAGTLIRPLVLSMSGPDGLGWQVFSGGCGLFLGSALMGAWGGPQLRTRAIAWFMALGGVAMAAHSLAPSLWLLIAVGPIFLFTLPVINSCANTLFQTKVESSSLGRVTATARMLSQAAGPLAYIVAGPLADGVFEPMLRPGGALAGSVGAVIGVGDGRGIAFMFLLAGGLLVVLALLASSPRVRRADRLPDLLHADPEQATTPGAATDGSAAGSPGREGEGWHGQGPGHDDGRPDSGAGGGR